MEKTKREERVKKNKKKKKKRVRESTDFLSGSVGCWKERERERESDETDYSKFSLRETFFE